MVAKPALLELFATAETEHGRLCLAADLGFREHAHRPPQVARRTLGNQGFHLGDIRLGDLLDARPQVLLLDANPQPIKTLENVLDVRCTGTDLESH